MTTMKERNAIAELLEQTTLCSGLGSGKKSADGKIDACSIAAINLALYGRLSDQIPECTSLVIGWWIIKIQDTMPFEIRNSPAWRIALIDAAGTGREHEQERLDLIMSWMWNLLEALTPVFPGTAQDAWRTMCEQKTNSAAATAAYAAAAAAAYADAYAAYAATDAAYAAYAAADAPVITWESIDPAGLLAALNAVGTS